MADKLHGTHCKHCGHAVAKPVPGASVTHMACSVKAMRDVQDTPGVVAARAWKLRKRP
jgi:hypothetical protein